MSDYDPKLPTLVFTMPEVPVQDRDLIRTWMLENFTGRANVVIVAATSAILLPPEDPNA